MPSDFQKFVQRESLKFSIDDIIINISRSTFYVQNDYKKTYNQINFSSFLSSIGPSNVEFDLRRINEIMEAGKAWFKNKMMSDFFFGKNKMEESPNNNSQNQHSPLVTRTKVFSENEIFQE